MYYDYHYFNTSALQCRERGDALIGPKTQTPQNQPIKERKRKRKKVGDRRGREQLRSIAALLCDFYVFFTVKSEQFDRLKIMRSSAMSLDRCKKIIAISETTTVT